MSFTQTATNKVSLVGFATMGAAVFVGLFHVLNVVIAGAGIAVVGYAIAALKNSSGPSAPTAVA